MEPQLTIKEINPEVFIRAERMLRVLFPNFSSGWIEACKDRLLDVEYIGKEKNADVFHVKRNIKFDGEPSGRGKSWGYRKVTLWSGKSGFCSCFFGPYSYKRRKELCSHIGACILFRFYFQILKQQEKV